MFVEILNNFNLEEYSHKDSRHQFFRMYNAIMNPSTKFCVHSKQKVRADLFFISSRLIFSNFWPSHSHIASLACNWKRCAFYIAGYAASVA